MSLRGIVLLLVCALAVTCCVGGPAPCDFGQVYRSRIKQTAFNASSCRNFIQVGQVYFDFPAQMLRYDLGSLTGEQEKLFTTIVNYNDGTVYTLNRARSPPTCTVGKITGSLAPNTFPPNATYEATWLLGQQPVLQYDLESFKYQDIDITMTVTEGSCFPVNTLAVNSTSHGVVYKEVHFNYIPEVPDNIFDMPSACISSTTPHVSSRHPELRRHLSSVERFLNAPWRLGNSAPVSLY